MPTRTKCTGNAAHERSDAVEIWQEVVAGQDVFGPLALRFLNH